MHKAPGFAKTVDIHRKPGYDPVELFFDPATRGIPLNAALVRGSHGAPIEHENQRGVILSSHAGVLGSKTIDRYRRVRNRAAAVWQLRSDIQQVSARRCQSRIHQEPNSMKTTRRNFLGTAAGVGALSLLHTESVTGAEVTDEALRKAAEKPVLQTKAFKGPIIIESLELLRKGKEHFVRVRSKDGAEGIAVDDGRMDILYPIFNRMVAPYFIGKDARDLEEHLFGVYREKDNYKFQGLALWVPVALVEFAILDMLGRISNQPIGELFGGVIRNDVQFYVASGRRDTTPEQEIDYLKSLIDKTGAKAIKYRVGGRMSRNVDAMPGRTENLIPLSRKALGDKMVILADANSSYDPPQAIEVGKMLEVDRLDSLRRAVPVRRFRGHEKSERSVENSHRAGRAGIEPLAVSGDD